VLGNPPVDRRTDLYAVGCLAYWLITGQLVFTGKTTMEILMHHAQTVPVPPSSRTEIEVPPRLDDIVLSCLAKNPDHRPASADVLSEALASITTVSPWTTPRAREWWNLNHRS
jgi:serine/threonine-protein kinase